MISKNNGIGGGRHNGLEPLFTIGQRPLDLLRAGRKGVHTHSTGNRRLQLVPVVRLDQERVGALAQKSDRLLFVRKTRSE